MTWAPSQLGGRGLRALEGLPAAAVVLSLPTRLLLTPAAARRDPVVSAALMQSGASLTDSSVLAVFLLYHASRGTESLWLPYIRALPRSYTDGGCWDDNAEELQVPYAVQYISSLATQRMEDYATASDVLALLGLPQKLRSYAAWCWAMSTVSTRTVFTSVEEAGTAGALCPVGDLVNHRVADGGAPCGYGELRGDTYVFVANETVPVGGEVFVSYGDLPSLQLLGLYGFVPDVGHLPSSDVALLPSGPHLEDILPGEPDALCVSMHDGAPGWRLLAALRLAHASQGARKARGHCAASGDMIDIESEGAAYSRLRLAASAALAALPTTEAHDVALGEAPHPHVALAVQWRLRYKRALRMCVKLCTNRVNWCDEQSSPTIVKR